MTTRLSVETKEQVARLVWESDDGLHRLNLGFLQELQEALACLAADKQVRVVMLTGTGRRVFSAGADLQEVAGIQDTGTAEHFSQAGQTVTATLASLPKPTLALLNGPAYGGGIELALACDFRLAAAHTTFRYRAGEWGLLPGWGGTQRLPHLIGLARARRMMLTGCRVTANDALAWGLVDALVDTGQEKSELEVWLAALKTQEPEATVQLKKALACTEFSNFTAERAAFAACFADGSTQARIRAWLERKSGGDRLAPPLPSVPEGTSSGADGLMPSTSSSAGATHG